MDKLESARMIINEVDEKMAKLFERRMEAVKEVALYKKERGLPIFDEKREKAVLEKNLEYIKDDELKHYYVEYMNDSMAVSRKYQHSLLEGTKIAYSGVEGAFAYIAAQRLFNDADLVSYKSFRDAYESVVNGECMCCVLPFENSFAGEVGQVLDLMFKGPLYVNGVYELTIIQNLLGVEGSNIEDIKKVISHPQALSQCASYIAQKGFEEEVASNTARAAKYVKELNDPSVGAIASKETAKLYGLKILESEINEAYNNTTRFAIFSKVPEKKTDKENNNFILLFTVNNIAGSLAKAIDVIGKYGFNMRVLRSRPLKDLAWVYYFYVEAEGDSNSLEGTKMLEELKENCDMLKVVGNFSSHMSENVDKENNDN